MTKTEEMEACPECDGTGVAERIQGWDRSCDACLGEGTIRRPTEPEGLVEAKAQELYAESRAPGRLSLTFDMTDKYVQEYYRNLALATLSPASHDSRLAGDKADCGHVNPTWFAPNFLWNTVMSGPDAVDDPGGVLCPICFIERAEAMGIKPSAWFISLEPEQPTAPAIRSTPAPDALREAREQGQREGKNAVCQWLRDRSATKPHAPFWKEAYALAVEFEHSEIPGRTEGKPS